MADYIERRKGYLNAYYIDVGLEFIAFLMNSTSRDIDRN